MTLELDVKELLNDPAVQNLLRHNDLDAVYDFYCEAFNEDYNLDFVINVLENILKSAGIDILKYIRSLARYNMFNVPFSLPIDLSQYTNIKKISSFGFTDCTFGGGIILPPSIITIGSEAFAHASIREGYNLKISTHH